MAGRSRVYIDSDVHDLVRRYAIKKGITIVEAYRRIVYSVLDGDANERIIVLDPDTVRDIDELARMLNVDRSRVIKTIVTTIKVLYDPRLSLGIALRPIRELAKMLGYEL